MKKWSILLFQSNSKNTSLFCPDCKRYLYRKLYFVTVPTTPPPPPTANTHNTLSLLLIQINSLSHPDSRFSPLRVEVSGTDNRINTPTEALLKLNWTDKALPLTDETNTAGSRL